MRPFPLVPDPVLTPGSKCGRPTEFRYPEKIPYCSRDVSSDVKYQVFIAYQRAGFALDVSKRRSFKIDHFIPLSLGGSNDVGNLWPQHSSIYQITDPIEQLLFNKLSAGQITQKDAIALIMSAKRNINEAKAILSKLTIEAYWQ